MKQPIMRAIACACLLVTVQTSAADCPQTAGASVPYPTEVVTDYVLGCMLANGTSADVLRKCSCSMDFISGAIPYEEYEKVETLLRLQQMPGAGRSVFYKTSNWAKNAIAQLREVQAESTLRCF